MTAATDDETYEDPIPEFVSRHGKTRPDSDRKPFKLDGDTYILLRPKLTLAVRMMQFAEDETRDTIKIGRDLAQLMLSIMEYVEREAPRDDEPQGQARLYARLNDPADPFDLIDLEPIFRALIKAWFGRPIGARPASSPEPRGSESIDSEADTPSTPDSNSGKSPRTDSSRSAKRGPSKATKRAPARAQK